MTLLARRPTFDGAPQTRKLKKGEILFAEGETSRAMYFLKTGMIRLYKKKGDSDIELDTVRAGQILGELAFLDGNPRSASGEALTDCELIEISSKTFQDVFANMPEWLKILLKTVVGRLRTASTRIRQLEVASTSFDYSDKDGRRTQQYTYLTPIEVLKIASALLLTASRYGKAVERAGIDIRVGMLQRYANQVMGVPVAKVTTLIDVLAQCGVILLGEEAHAGEIILKDIEFLDQLVAYLNEENLLDPAKRHDISPKGFLIMSLIAKNLKRYKKDEVSGFSVVNMAEVKSLEAAALGRDPFKLDEIKELVTLNYATPINMKSATEAFTTIKVDDFLLAFKLQRVVIAINAVNESKKRIGGK